ncbi:hypothetical protein LSTR_LSTR000093 [Laodelphax striatellus]|uniref:Uncharacterized protein n=1 Tax=Laodelphax striatellus TaxID=195883 RepID=A0A482X668_LAOST|nr:hypothetical protein LSTR_LSTR000093 [Laodelphax striatellus]
MAWEEACQRIARCTQNSTRCIRATTINRRPVFHIHRAAASRSCSLSLCGLSSSFSSAVLHSSFDGDVVLHARSVSVRLCHCPWKIHQRLFCLPLERQARSLSRFVSLLPGTPRLSRRRRRGPPKSTFSDGGGGKALTRPPPPRHPAARISHHFSRLVGSRLATGSYHRPPLDADLGRTVTNRHELSGLLQLASDFG